MGCDIHSFAEVRRNGVWEVAGDVFPLDEWERDYHKKTHDAEPFGTRNYGVFAFLADVRNYSDVPPISQPRGFPSDASPTVRAAYEEWDYDAHSSSWLTVSDLDNIDYDAQIEDRRVTVQIGPNSFDGGATAEPGGGEMKTWRTFLGSEFMADLEVLRTLGPPEDVRIVFWFDN